jgi:alginate O-acetyltransferase complex protein AlgI
MSFISFQFAAFFLLAAIAYFATPLRYRWFALLALSYLFYALGDVRALPLLLLSTVLSFSAGLAVERFRSHSPRRLIVVVSIIFNLLVLLVFKYLNFFAGSLAGLVGQGYTVLDVLLPLGISFYTFQCMAYPVDVYRGTLPAERHFGIFAAYIAFFPKLVAGPIERAVHLLPQFRAAVAFDEASVVSALRLILWGAFKKVVVADRLAIYVNAVYAEPQRYHGWPMIAAVIFFAFQIYCDFSAYTDIARGIARILGFDLLENFRQPYLSRSVREFWRRWHISLSTWFRDYLYIPLGGSRVSFLRMLLNLIIVFAVSGLWHGASWTFVIWGALHGGLVVVETLMSRVLPASRPRAFTVPLQMLVTFALVCFAWIFFRAPTLDSALYVITHLFEFTQGTENLMRPFSEAFFPQEWEFVIALALLVLLVISDWIDARWGIIAAIERRRMIVRWALYYGMAFVIGVSLWLTITATQDFIYRRF